MVHFAMESQNSVLVLTVADVKQSLWMWGGTILLCLLYVYIGVPDVCFQVKRSEDLVFQSTSLWSTLPFFQPSRRRE